MSVTNLVRYLPQDDDFDSPLKECTAKQDDFARLWAEMQNRSAAYRTVYKVADNTSPQVVWTAAYRLAELPHVKARYEEYKEKILLELVVTAKEMIQWQYDIATADPNEIGYVAKRACRHCYGNGHAYHWTNEDEYLEACVDAIDNKRPTPSDIGGYGYTRGKSPALDCPYCLGNGLSETIINDTTKLGPKARKLYKGLDFKNGEWVVLMHDQEKAWEKVGRMLGAFKDGGIDMRRPNPDAAKIAQGVTEQEAARQYLTMIG